MAQRRSIFLINKNFQFRFAFYTCSWLVALSFVYPLIIFELFDFFLRYMAADPNSPEVSALLQTRESLLYLLVSMEIVLLSITFLLSIFMSHRIAGPLFKLKRFFGQAGTGKIGEKLFFRKSDHFHDIADSYNQMMTGLGTILATQAADVGAAAQKIEKLLPRLDPESREDLETIVAKLRQVQQTIPR